MPKSAKLAYNVARSLERAGDIDGAIKAYDDYLRLAPHALDRPAVKQVRATLVAELKRQQARLVITSHPDGADIFLDGDLATPVGRTPTRWRRRRRARTTSGSNGVPARMRARHWSFAATE